jgi:hypothetical protein
MIFPWHFGEKKKRIVIFKNSQKRKNEGNFPVVFILRVARQKKKEIEKMCFIFVSFIPIEGIRWDWRHRSQQQHSTAGHERDPPRKCCKGHPTVVAQQMSKTWHLNCAVRTNNQTNVYSLLAVSSAQLLRTEKDWWQGKWTAVTPVRTVYTTRKHVAISSCLKGENVIHQLELMQ